MNDIEFLYDDIVLATQNMYLVQAVKKTNSLFSLVHYDEVWSTLDNIYKVIHFILLFAHANTRHTVIVIDITTLPPIVTKWNRTYNKSKYRSANQWIIDRNMSISNVLLFVLAAGAGHSFSPISRNNFFIVVVKKKKL